MNTNMERKKKKRLLFVCLMLWRVLVDSFQADIDFFSFFFSPFFENRKFRARIKKQNKQKKVFRQL